MLPPDRGFDLETDLLVIGAGAAGMTAALVGALEGLRVILCEKSDVVGGTTATTYLAAMLGKDAGDGRLDAYLASGPAVLDDLEKRSLVSFVPPPLHPDYRDLPGAALRGRALGTAPFDGRKLGADFDRVRPPRHEFTVLGGMMVGKNDIAPLQHPFRSWANFAHATQLLARQAFDRLRYRRGTRLIMGNALVARLLHDLKRQAVDIRYQTALEELVKDGNEVVGAILLSPEGKRAVRARKGVVLATGGIGWSEALRERLFPEQARRTSLAPASNTGYGILAGERASGVIEQQLESPALWMPSSTMTQANGELSVFPHILLDRAKPGLLAVDKTGKRFVNEANSYHDFVDAMLRSNRLAASVPAHLV